MNRFHRAIYAVIVLIVSHYACVIPIAMMGYWQNYLVPGLEIVSLNWHLIIILIAWIYFGTTKSVKVSCGLVLIAFAITDPIFDRWPWYSMPTFWPNVIITVLGEYASPIWTAALLIYSPRIAPLLIRNWHAEA